MTTDIEHRGWSPVATPANRQRHRSRRPPAGGAWAGWHGCSVLAPSWPWPERWPPAAGPITRSTATSRRSVQQRRDFVPTVRVATVRASDSTHVWSACRPRPPPSRRPTSLPARAAISTSAMSTSAIGSRKARCWRDRRARSSTSRSRRREAHAGAAPGGAAAGAGESRNSRRYTWNRDSPLVKQGWVTQQQGAIDVQNLKAQQAAVDVAQANVVAQQAQLGCSISRRPISASSRRSTASSPSATSTSAAWCRPMRPAAPSCSRSCRAMCIRTQVYVPQERGVRPGVPGVEAEMQRPGNSRTAPFPAR